MANHPHNPARPANARVKGAVAADNIHGVMRALTGKQKKFCEEFVVDNKLKEASIRAGYRPNNAYQQGQNLMKNEGVRFYIDYLNDQRAEQITCVDADYVITRINDIVQKPGTKDSDVLRGLELIAKHLGMFIDRTEISGRDGEAIKIEKIEEDADALASAITSLKDRGGNSVIPLFPNKRTAS